MRTNSQTDLHWDHVVFSIMSMKATPGEKIKLFADDTNLLISGLLLVVLTSL